VKRSRDFSGQRKFHVIYSGEYLCSVPVSYSGGRRAQMFTKIKQLVGCEAQLAWKQIGRGNVRGSELYGGKCLEGNCASLGWECSGKFPGNCQEETYRGEFSGVNCLVGDVWREIVRVRDARGNTGGIVRRDVRRNVPRSPMQDYKSLSV